MKSKILEGKLLLFSEQGMEGGYLSIQDKEFIDLDKWDYKGLHFLENEDLLKIIDPTTRKVICEGQLDQIPLMPFSQTLNGHFEHIKQDDNCNWKQYFEENYFAELYK